MASVKDFSVETPPTATDLGRGAFVFSDAYSVFDWGAMPDSIPRKGASLCAMGAATFEEMEAAGIPTHYLGVGPDAEPLAAVTEPPDHMAIELTQVPDLPYRDGSYAYADYHEQAGENYLIPLEIVFRNTVPVGSSLRSRTTPAELGLKLDRWPAESIPLPEPIVEFSTKYEESDRYLTEAEADQIAGTATIDTLQNMARDVNAVVTQLANRAGLDHLDGKIECLYHDGTVKIADVTGTFDENRFAYEGQQLSKEVVRQYYKRTDTDWVDAIATAKERAQTEDIVDWRTLCDRDPQPLPGSVRQLVADMYTAGANAYLDRTLFDVPPLVDVVDEIAALAEE